MSAGGGNILARLSARLGLTGAAAILAGPLEGYDEPRASRVFAPAWIGLMAFSFVWGLVAIGVYVVVLRLTGRVSPPLWTAAGVLAAMSLAGPYRRGAMDLAALAGVRRPVTLWVSLVLAGAGWAAATAYLRLAHHTGMASEEQALPAALAWIRPDLEAFRVLLLAPMWGAWAMMIAVQFRRPGPGCPPAIRAFAGGCGPMLSMAVLAAIWAWSILYFSFLPWHQLTISGAAILGGIAGGVLAGRRARGVNRGVLLAANLSAQIAFLLAYLANVAR